MSAPASYFFYFNVVAAPPPLYPTPRTPSSLALDDLWDNSVRAAQCAPLTYVRVPLALPVFLYSDWPTP